MVFLPCGCRIDVHLFVFQTGCNIPIEVGGGGGGRGPVVNIWQYFILWIFQVLDARLSTGVTVPHHTAWALL